MCQSMCHEVQANQVALASDLQTDSQFFNIPRGKGCPRWRAVRVTSVVCDPRPWAGSGCSRACAHGPRNLHRGTSSSTFAASSRRRRTCGARRTSTSASSTREEANSSSRSTRQRTPARSSTRSRRATTAPRAPRTRTTCSTRTSTLTPSGTTRVTRMPSLSPCARR